MQQQHKPHLLRGLNARHIRFIALGSAIGTGLFYGSASAIKAAGPAVLLASPTSPSFSPPALPARIPSDGSVGPPSLTMPTSS
ncbi:hypothetical protein V6134_18920, partial [Klebsiella pneumoniae]